MAYNKSFVPSGCPKAMATPGITLGAGAQFADVYAYADSLDVVVVGGADPSVGAAGGWAMGGGHSALSQSLGLGVDRVVCKLLQLIKCIHALTQRYTSWNIILLQQTAYSELRTHAKIPTFFMR
jgi:hypothetical protein